jgi:hypothetical protein
MAQVIGKSPTPELAAQAAEDFQFIRTSWERELKP